MSKTEQKQILILDPAGELHFCGPFKEVVTSYLKLTNPSERRVCFKVKTTAPKKYCVRPNSGILVPKEVVNVAVMLQPFEYNPNEKNKHKFMVQTMFIPDGEMNADNLWRDPKPESLMDSKLKCVFDMPCEIAHNNNLDSNAIQSGEEQKIIVSKNVSETSIKASLKDSNSELEVKMVKDENTRLRDELHQIKQENAQLKEEGLRLRARGNVSSEGRGPSMSHAGGEKEGAPSSAFGGVKMAEQQQSPMLYLAVILTVGLLGIFIGKFIV